MSENKKKILSLVKKIQTPKVAISKVIDVLDELVLMFLEEADRVMVELNITKLEQVEDTEILLQLRDNEIIGGIIEDELLKIWEVNKYSILGPILEPALARVGGLKTHDALKNLASKHSLLTKEPFDEERDLNITVAYTSTTTYGMAVLKKSFAKKVLITKEIRQVRRESWVKTAKELRDKYQNEIIISENEIINQYLENITKISIVSNEKLSKDEKIFWLFERRILPIYVPSLLELTEAEVHELVKKYTEELIDLDFDKAIKALPNVYFPPGAAGSLKVTPELMKALVNEGWINLLESGKQQGNLKKQFINKAGSNFFIILNKHPRFVPALVGLAIHSYTLANNIREACEFLAKAFTVNFELTRNIIDNQNFHPQLQKIAKIIEHEVKELALKEKFEVISDVHELLKIIQQSTLRQDVKTAHLAVKRAYSLDSENEEVIFHYAGTCLVLRKTLKAIELFEKYFQLKEPDEMSLILYAKACIDWEDLGKAKEAVEKALSIKKTLQGTETLDIINKKIQERDEEIEKVDKRRAESNKPVKKKFTKTLEKLDDVTSLLESDKETDSYFEQKMILEKVLEIDPENVEAMLQLGLLFGETRRLIFYRKIVDLDPTNIENYLRIAKACTFFKEHIGFIAIDKAIEMDPLNLKYIYKRDRFLQSLSNKASMRMMFDQIKQYQ